MITSALSEVARLIKNESGIELGPSQLPSLQAAIGRIDRELAPETLLDRPVSPETMRRLIDEITIRETFFFRHRSELEAIDWHSMLDIARAGGSDVVRVWVAGCASGEEAYTVAILACEAFACSRPPVRVLGTDISPTAVEQAIAGRYNERSVRLLHETIRERYFTGTEGTTRVGEHLRGLVEFRRHNLVREPIPPTGEPFDVILCRNVLIYFDRPTVEHVLGALEGALGPAGLLLLGAADRLSRQHLPPTTPVSKTLLGTEAKNLGCTQPAVGWPTRAPSDPRRTPAGAMEAANRGELEQAVQIAREVLAAEPLDSQAHFIRGLAELARGNARDALEPLRRALYIDPNFALATFKLACAHDALGEVQPARRAYERTLRTLDHCEVEQTARSNQSDMLNIAGACHTRLRTLAGRGHIRAAAV
jgi:chemotaxis protein methyltransferase CheR